MLPIFEHQIVEFMASSGNGCTGRVCARGCVYVCAIRGVYAGKSTSELKIQTWTPLKQLTVCEWSIFLGISLTGVAVSSATESPSLMLPCYQLLLN